MLALIFSYPTSPRQVTGCVECRRS